MQAALRITTRVLPGNRIEITAPGLTEGAPVDVFLVLPETPASPCRSVLEFLDSLPPGPRLFKTSEEADRYLREERDTWDR
jgi:hypothetical protein